MSNTFHHGKHAPRCNINFPRFYSKENGRARHRTNVDARHAEKAALEDTLARVNADEEVDDVLFPEAPRTEGWETW